MARRVGAHSRQTEPGKVARDAALQNRFYAALTEGGQAQSDEQALRRQTMAWLQRVAAQLEAFSAEAASKVGMHRSDLIVLLLLDIVGNGTPVRAAEIQRALGFTPGGMTRRLDAMERQGLVERLADPEDGRAWLVAPTIKGREQIAVGRAEAGGRNKRLHAEFSVSEWQVLVGLLARLSSALDAKG